ncbi:ATP-binding protein [Mucilaginibacter glaciei]|uniref:ATP-binding protein n=1 Tax=Mucilaginibacter glaciei TaxID=2772109 RepID=A0A926P0A2_9SPHI|nr:ATP-binding protein [Mucilaginibacter glaciei]MBD1395248.1 ATP-binding protein [Mucilaginibacter glaciei]
MAKKEISDFELGQLIESRLRQLQYNLPEADDINDAENPEQKAEERIVSEISDEDLAAMIEKALVKAALSGDLLPQGLLPEGTTVPVEEAVLTQILPHFDILKNQSETTWCLSLKYRQEIIRRLISNGTLSRELDGPLPPTDFAGKVLRSFLKQEFVLDVTRIQADRSGILQIIKVLEWLQGIEIPLPDIDDLRAHWRSIQLLPDQDILLKSGFVGRAAELKQLKQFISGDTGGRALPSLIINGIGGAGKSTLVARLCQDIHQSKNVLLAILDFDKPGMDPSDTYWLESEITRQVSSQFPQIYRRISLARKEIKEAEDSYYSGAAAGSYEGRDRSRRLRRIITMLKDELITKGLADFPLLLILDTFEEVMQLSMIEEIKDWLEELREYLLPVGLKVIYSGRFSAEPHEELGLSRACEVVSVGEFDKRLTAHFLEIHHIDKKTALEIAGSRLLPKRPLELKLLAQVLIAEPSLRFRDLEAQLAREGGHDLFAGIVYRRVLLRIKDSKIRELAHPGLILRFLTADLIQKVVCPVLGMPYMELKEAQRILDALASYAWLAYKSKSGEVWHRKDLRRSMIRLMILENPQTADRLHLAAIEYFQRRNDESSHQEVIYHRLMTAETDGFLSEISEKELKFAWPSLQADVDDLPIQSRITLKYVAQRVVKLDEISYLPEKYHSYALRQAAQQAAIRGNYSTALKVVLELHQELDDREFNNSQISFNYDSYRFEPWELSVFLNTARWNYFYTGMEPMRRTGNIKHLVDLLYIQEVILHRENTETSGLQELIAEYPSRNTFSSFSASRVELLQKLLACLASLAAKNIASGRFRDSVHELAKHIAMDTRRKNPEGFEKLLYLIEVAADRRPYDGFMISLASLPLDPEWLQKFLSESSEEIARPAAELMERLPHLTSLTVKNALRTLSSYNRPDEFYRMPFDQLMGRTAPAYLVQLMVGAFPDFQNPSKYAIIDLMQETRDWHRLYDLFRRIININIREWDYPPQRLIDLWRENPETALSPYIELIDRSWKLPHLMEELCHYYPHNYMIKRVFEAIASLDDKLKYIYSTRLNASL